MSVYWDANKTRCVNDYMDRRFWYTGYGKYGLACIGCLGWSVGLDQTQEMEHGQTGHGIYNK